MEVTILSQTLAASPSIGAALVPFPSPAMDQEPPAELGRASQRIWQSQTVQEGMVEEPWRSSISISRGGRHLLPPARGWVVPGAAPGAPLLASLLEISVPWAGDTRLCPTWPGGKLAGK